MLKITVTIEPHGLVEQSYTLYEIDIINRETDDDTNHANYSVICKGVGLGSRLGARVEDFDRSRGAIALIRDALDHLLEGHSVRLKAPPLHAPLPILTQNVETPH